jgi:hypothetical protein
MLGMVRVRIVWLSGSWSLECVGLLSANALKLFWHTLLSANIHEATFVHQNPNKRVTNGCNVYSVCHGVRVQWQGSQRQARLVCRACVACVCYWPAHVHGCAHNTHCTYTLTLRLDSSAPSYTPLESYLMFIGCNAMMVNPNTPTGDKNGG